MNNYFLKFVLFTLIMTDQLTTRANFQWRWFVLGCVITFWMRFHMNSFLFRQNRQQPEEILIQDDCIWGEILLLAEISYHSLLRKQNRQQLEQIPNQDRLYLGWVITFWLRFYINHFWGDRTDYKQSRFPTKMDVLILFYVSNMTKKQRKSKLSSFTELENCF